MQHIGTAWVQASVGFGHAYLTSFVLVFKQHPMWGKDNHNIVKIFCL